MNIKTLSTKTVLLIAALVLVVTIVGVYAYDSFTKEYTWGISDPDFEVYTDAGYTTLMDTSTLNLGNKDINQQQTLHFYIKNTGNEAITVNADATLIGATDPIWSGNPNIAVGGFSQFTFVFTITGPGSAAINFSIV